MVSARKEKDPEVQNLLEHETSFDEPEENKDEKAAATSAVKAIYACMLYSSCSVSMVLVNKSLASR
jgi:hypothetical protein